MDISRENKLSELIMRHLQGDNSPQELQQLKQLLSDDAEAVELYVEYMMQFSALVQPGKVVIEDFSQEPSPSMLDTSLWMALSKYEKEAPEIELPQEKPPRELIQKVVYPPRERRHFSRFSIFILLNAAAVFLVIVFLRFASPEAGIEVATLTDTINAKWADVGVPMQIGTRLSNNKTRFLLREGLAELKFDNNARVTIEGPAEFQILDADMIKLNYGQLYSHVPPEAFGFQISTQHAKVIDLGTEFGVKVGIDRDTEVHVLKGQVNLVSGVLNKKINIDLLAGSARKLDTVTGELKEIPCKNHLFARQIESKTNTIWRGQKTLDLADIVGGGNGFGNGIINSGFDAETGQRCLEVRTIDLMNGTNQYKPVTESGLIDGVFTLNNRERRVRVDSAGHSFDPGYLTEGKYWGYIMDGAFHLGLGVPRHTLMLDGQPCGTRDNPAIGIHSDMGITFDLNEIRKQVPEISIGAFTAKVGVSETVANIPKEHFGKVDFWVLLDGEVKFSKRIHWQDGSCLIDLPVQLDNRFLTLIVTDAGDHDNISYDWAMFVNPALELRQDD